jgi:DNA-binding transcriptional ArsR family regulator
MVYKRGIKYVDWYVINNDSEGRERVEDEKQVEQDRQRAEIFDALGHPTRIQILKVLSEGSLGFADLKKKTAIESSGHLQHHLTKLNGLIKTDEYGKYCLSDEGKDALLTFQTVENASPKKEVKEKGYNHLKVGLKPVAILLTFLLIASTAIAVYEYSQTVNLKKNNLSPSILTSYSNIKDGLQLSITLQSGKTQYLSGEVVPITFTISNVSNQTLTFSNVNGNSNFNFQVYNGNNAEVYSWVLGAYPLTNATIPLNPNENYAQTLNWNSETNMFSGFSQAKAGVYYIMGEIGENQPYELQTTPLAITIISS